MGLSRVQGDTAADVQEGNLRFSLSYGFEPDNNAVGFPDLPPFNRLGRETRMAPLQCLGPLDAGGDDRALFHRRCRNRRDKGQVLVVSKVAPGD